MGMEIACGPTVQGCILSLSSQLRRGCGRVVNCGCTCSSPVFMLRVSSITWPVSVRRLNLPCHAHFSLVFLETDFSRGDKYAGLDIGNIWQETPNTPENILKRWQVDSASFLCAGFETKSRGTSRNSLQEISWSLGDTPISSLHEVSSRRSRESSAQSSLEISAG